MLKELLLDFFMVALGVSLGLTIGSLLFPLPATKTTNTDIPYCYAESHDFYLPCAYSSRKYDA